MSVKQLIVIYGTGCLLLSAAGCRAETGSVQQTTTNTQTSTSTTQQASSAQASAANSNSTAVTSTVSGNQNVQNVTSQNSNTTAGQTGRKLDPCSLISPSEIASVQGEEVKETKAAPGNSSRLAVAQCFYQTTTPNKSVSLELTQRLSAQPGVLSPREFWKENFEHERRERERGRERKRESEREKKREAEKREAGGGKEEDNPAIRVSGVGDEAFWASNMRAGALYVLKGDSIIRISIGGIADQNARLEKSKALARLALKRLKD